MGLAFLQYEAEVGPALSGFLVKATGSSMFLSTLRKDGVGGESRVSITRCAYFCLRKHQSIGKLGVPYLHNYANDLRQLCCSEVRVVILNDLGELSRQGGCRGQITRTPSDQR